VDHYAQDLCSLFNKHTPVYNKAQRKLKHLDKAPVLVNQFVAGLCKTKNF